MERTNNTIDDAVNSLGSIFNCSYAAFDIQNEFINSLAHRL